jgi:hypothetical protein
MVGQRDRGVSSSIGESPQGRTLVALTRPPAAGDGIDPLRLTSAPTHSGHRCSRGDGWPAWPGAADVAEVMR